MRFCAHRLITATLFILASGCSEQQQEEIADVPSMAIMKAQQVEAEQFLRQVYSMQQTYFTATQQYGPSLDEIGVRIPAGARYRYSLKATGVAWSCDATANLDGDATVDRWSVDQSGRIACVVNDATS